MTFNPFDRFEAVRKHRSAQSMGTQKRIGSLLQFARGRLYESIQVVQRESLQQRRHYSPNAPPHQANRAENWSTVFQFFLTKRKYEADV
jgi:hypothetical protein